MAGGRADGPSHVGRDVPSGLAQLLSGDLERSGGAVELPREPAQRAVAVIPHAIDNLSHPAIEGWIARPAALE